MKEITVRPVTRAKRADIVRLYRQAGWWKPGYPEDAPFIDDIVTGSLCFAGAFHDERMIGMGRLISDGVSDAYIQDVTVEKEFRGRGIAKRIIAELVRAARARGIDWIGLIAEPGTAAFYEPLGFEVMKNHVAMLYRGNR